MLDFLQQAHVLRKAHERGAEQFTREVRRSGLGRRKAYYLVAIAKQLDGLSLSRSQLEAIGWTKLQVISKHLTHSNADALLRRAAHLNTRALKLSMRGKLPKLKAHCVELNLNPAQYAQFVDAILRNGGELSGRGLRNKELALIKAIRNGSRG